MCLLFCIHRHFYALIGLSGGRPSTATSAFHTLPLVSLGQLPSTTTTAIATVPSSSAKELPGVIVSPSLPPIPGKVINNVWAGLFVDLREMFPDNAALTKQILETGSNAGSKLQELEDPLSWAFYFLAFLAISVPDKRAKELAAYGQIVIQLAQRHGGGAGSPMTDCSVSKLLQGPTPLGMR
uniref:Uncharacterized protein n=1 Tax=Amphimedon queenslandica TaxID=400682 RepID=A0A1X7T8W3_AMPQE